MTTNFQDFVDKRRLQSDDDSKYIEIAIKAAEHARANGDNPFGAVLSYPGGHMVEHDTCFTDRDHTCHAEMNVMRKAARIKLRNMGDCVLYTTVEPCPMCAHAAMLSGIREIVFGAYDSKNGFLSSDKLLEVADGMAVKGGVLAARCVGMVPDVFKEYLKVEKSDG
jgi:tRNA(adenine34) deaminase